MPFDRTAPAQHFLALAETDAVLATVYRRIARVFERAGTDCTTLAQYETAMRATADRTSDPAVATAWGIGAEAARLVRRGLVLQGATS